MLDQKQVLDTPPVRQGRITRVMPSSYRRQAAASQRLPSPQHARRTREAGESPQLFPSQPSAATGQFCAQGGGADPAPPPPPPRGQVRLRLRLGVSGPPTVLSGVGLGSRQRPHAPCLRWTTKAHHSTAEPSLLGRIFSGGEKEEPTHETGRLRTLPSKRTRLLGPSDITKTNLNKLGSPPVATQPRVASASESPSPRRR